MKKYITCSAVIRLGRLALLLCWQEVAEKNIAFHLFSDLEAMNEADARLLAVISLLGQLVQ